MEKKTQLPRLSSRTQINKLKQCGKMTWLLWCLLKETTFVSEWQNHWWSKLPSLQEEHYHQNTTTSVQIFHLTLSLFSFYFLQSFLYLLVCTMSISQVHFKEYWYMKLPENPNSVRYRIIFIILAYWTQTNSWKLLEERENEREKIPYLSCMLNLI